MLEGCRPQVSGSVVRDDRTMSRCVIHVLAFLIEKARSRILPGWLADVVGLRSGEGDVALELLALLADAERCLVSASTSSSLTLS